MIQRINWQLSKRGKGGPARKGHKMEAWVTQCKYFLGIKIRHENTVYSIMNIVTTVLYV